MKKQTEITKGTYKVADLNSPGQSVIIKHLGADVAFILICEETNKIAICRAINPGEIGDIIDKVTLENALRVKIKVVSPKVEKDSAELNQVLSQQSVFIGEITSIERSFQNIVGNRNQFFFPIEYQTIDSDTFSIDLTGAVEIS